MPHRRYKTIISIFFLFFMPVFTFSQSERVEGFHTMKATLIGLAYSYEMPIAQKSTINLQAMAAGGLGFGVGNSKSYYYWGVVPKLRFEPRYYYNYLNPRNGDKDNSNSPNYLTLTAEYQFAHGIGENIDVKESLTLIPKWGAKRIFREHFVFEFAVGVGAGLYEFEDWKVAFGMDIFVGRIISRK